MLLIIKARGIAKGVGKGVLLISSEPISFLSGIDPSSGVITEEGNQLKGQSIAGKVFAFTYGKGSTVGSYVMYALKKNGKAPTAIINEEAEPIIAVGAIISDIPMVDHPSTPLKRLKSGTPVTVNGDTGEITYEGELESY